MIEKHKYPRTFHLPWSPGATDDDKTLSDVTHFAGKQIVVTCKMDGENTTIYHDGSCHARSMDSVSHPSRTLVRKLAGTVGPQLPLGWRICGENLYAKHSIKYQQLQDYLLVFAIYDQDNFCLSWGDTVEWCQLLGLSNVPVLYEGLFDETQVKSCFKGLVNNDPQEGYVVRLVDTFHYSDFSRSVAKYVRKNHVQTSTHWLQQALVANQLAKR